MFTGSYKINNQQMRLSFAGTVGLAIFFTMMNFIMTWQILHNETLVSYQSQLLLIGFPLILPFVVAGIYWGISKWRNNNIDYSYGVSYYWTAVSFLPLLAMISLTSYIGVDMIQTGIVHAGGLILSGVLYSLLARSHSKSTASIHDKLMLFSIVFYLVALVMQMGLLITGV